MGTSLKQNEPPDVSVKQRTSNELIKMIRKLRWMGMEEEAKTIQTELTHAKVGPADSVVAAPRETD